MTNKTLSEQICEVCGIEPEIIEDYDSNEYEIYPDFENNNNNFVKLQEMLAEFGMGYTCQLIDVEPNKIEISFLWEEGFTVKTIGETFKEAYLRFVLQILAFEKGEEVQTIAESIRQADWEV